MTAAPFAMVFAHQGGWDEIALVVLPLLLLFGLLALANRRAKSLASARDTDEDAPDHG